MKTPAMIVGRPAICSSAVVSTVPMRGSGELRQVERRQHADRQRDDRRDQDHLGGADQRRADAAADADADRQGAVGEER